MYQRVVRYSVPVVVRMGVKYRVEKERKREREIIDRLILCAEGETKAVSDV